MLSWPGKETNRSLQCLVARPLGRMEGSRLKAAKKERKRWERSTLDCGSHFLEVCPHIFRSQVPSSVS